MKTYSVELRLNDFYVMEADDKEEAAALAVSLAAEEYGLDDVDIDIINVKEID